MQHLSQPLRAGRSFVLASLTAWSLVSLLQLPAAIPAEPPSDAEKPLATRKAAIFVTNRAGEMFDDRVPMLEDLLASRISRLEFQVLSREIITRALKQYPVGIASPADESPGQRLDRMLSDSTSALRLAQVLGADYVLVPAISSYGSENRSYSSDGVKTENQRHNLRVSYRLAEAAQGGEIQGDSIQVSKTLRQSDGLQVESTDIINQLLNDAAARLAETIVARAQQIPAVVKDGQRVKVRVRCTITDFSQLPNAGLNEENEVVLGAGQADAYALNVNVELDGITLGSAPGVFQVAPGLHRLRLTREGFAPFDRMINAYEGQSLTVALQMSEAGYARWKDVVATLTGLENNRKLTDAEVKVLEGYARMFRQSGIRVDTKEGLKFFRSLYW